METVKNMIWGESKTEQSGQEPVSGQIGEGTVDKPYDAGNTVDDPALGGASAQEAKDDNPGHIGSHNTYASNILDPKTSDSARDQTFGSGAGGPVTSDTTSSTRPTDALSFSNPSQPTGGVAQGSNVAGFIPLEHDTDKTGVTGIHSNDPNSSDVRPSEANTSTSGTTAGGFGTANPSVTADPASAAKLVPTAQGGERPIEAPRDETEALLAKKDPNDHSVDPMKMHDGSEKVLTKEQRRKSVTNTEGGSKHGGEKGTGEKVIPASGFAAEGGDFDASKAGAGREAQRLMDEKERTTGTQGNMSHDVKHHESIAGSEDISTSATDSTGKVSKMEKIKEKLHIGKH